MNNPKDVMIDIRVYLKRDGTLGLDRQFPSDDPIVSDRIISLGMLETAKSMIAREFRDGEAP
jgi:hypothetical protein